MSRRILRDFRGLVLLYVGLGIACAVLSGVAVLYMQRMVDWLTRGGGAQPLAALIAGYGLASLAVCVLSYLEEYPQNQLLQGMYQRIKLLALQKVSTIDYTDYQDTGTGQLVQLVENGATAGRNILFDYALRTVSELIPGAVVSVVIMGVYDLRVMLGALGGYVVVFIITRLLLGKLYSIKERTLISEEWLSKRYVRAFMEMVVLRVNRRFPHELTQARRLAKDIVDAHTHIKLVHEFFFTSFAVLVLLIKLILIITSVPQVLGGTMSVGVLLALLTLADNVYQPIAIFNVIYVDYKLDRVTWGRFMDFIGQRDDAGLLAGTPYAPGEGRLRFEDVSFAYGRADVLREVSLDIAPGQMVALVGVSGGGKSTLMKLAMGLVKPAQGHIYADGQDLAALDLNSLYAHTAYVSQDPPIFDGTLRENICFDQDAPDEALLDVLRLARLDGLLATLPDGLDTKVGEHGVKLSGGEKQRLAIARVLWQRPTFVILDEPTSALDQETEQGVIDTIRQALHGTTVLYIAHRLSTVRYADRIVVLEGGAVVEQGTHEALAAAQGAYARLLRAGEDG